MTEPEILATEEAIAYWDSRHKHTGELRSGGDRSYTHEQNEVFYALRLGRLIDVLGLAEDPPRELLLLDAGCGKGYFSSAMGRFGQRVDGIDSSEHAIALCTDRAGARERYAVSTLADWAPAELYDAVYCVDVAFHIMEDDVWAASMRNLASLVRLGGLLVVADHDADEDHVWGSYQKTRSGRRYDELFAEHGFSRSGAFVPYRFYTSPAGFHVFRKES